MIDEKPKAPGPVAGVDGDRRYSAIRSSSGAPAPWAGCD